MKIEGSRRWYDYPVYIGFLILSVYMLWLQLPKFMARFLPVKWVKQFEIPFVISNAMIPSVYFSCNEFCGELCKKIVLQEGAAIGLPAGFENFQVFFTIQRMSTDSVSIQANCHIYLDCGCPDKFRFLMISVHPLNHQSKIEQDINISWGEYMDMFMGLKGGA